MERSQVYSGTITAEQFLFYEIRIASKYYLDGVPVEAAIEEIKGNNKKGPHSFEWGLSLSRNPVAHYATTGFLVYL